MDKTGIAIWKALSVTEKTRFTSIFHERHLSGFDWRKMGIIDLVERDAYLLAQLDAALQDWLEMCDEAALYTLQSREAWLKQSALIWLRKG